ncbi:MAG: lysophospholipid acyltransferase family protein [Tannerella sp.]|jgi:putative hemolysin|nr:lysophospholipid acyltransferase family protein [Tannerella sp.]
MKRFAHRLPANETMKKTVLDIEEIRGKVSFFKTRLGTWLLKKIFRWLDMDKVNQIHANHYQLRGSAFTSAILSDPLMDVHYEVHNREILQQLPEGAFITVSNHPIGSLDGIILIDIFASIRPDFRVMVNEILAHISAMEDNFIHVIPRTDDSQGSRKQNVNGIRLSLIRLRNGHPMGFFPAGAMSFYDKKQKKVEDLPWTHSVIRLIRKANVPVYPVYFDCLNSGLFYCLGRISWKLRVLRVAKEAFNKKGRTIHVYIGNPIPPQKIKMFTNDTELADFLHKSTYNIK